MFARIGSTQIQGDDFDYESFITEELAKLPKPGSVDHNSIFSAFKNVSKDFIK